MRLWPFTRRRVLDISQIGDINSRIDLLSTAEARRTVRTNEDMLAAYGAVYAAVRLRVRAMGRLGFGLVRRRGADWVKEPDDHPALQAIYEVNEGLTGRQGIGLIEQHKLTTGKAYWIKRRNGLGRPVEFEIWNPTEVEVVADPRKPWLPEFFRRHMPSGSIEQVAMRDVIWFRHLVDPRNPLNGLGPIGAIRTEADTAIEAQRFNQRYFDNAMHLGQTFAAKDAGPAEVDRLEQELARKFRGTDRAFRGMVLAGDLQVLESKVPHKDMEFIAQLRWGVEEVARAFEISPIMLGDLSRGTFENADQSNRFFWEMIVDQFEAMLDEFTEFYIWPDFGREYRLMGHYEGIDALQENQKLRAEVDEVYLRTGKVYINELRDRDGQEPVPWGNVPIMPNTMLPFGSAPPPIPPRSHQRGLIEKEEEKAEELWASILESELEGIIKHLRKAARALDPGDVDSYDWNWTDEYGTRVTATLAGATEVFLAAAGFVETPLLSAHKLAVNYASRRAGEMLKLEGRESVVALTRQRVAQHVADTIEKGDSLNTLTKKLREDFAFSKSRADMIARTETRRANTHANLASYQSQGTEGKEWLTAGDERVCDICLSAEGQGPISVTQPFNNGYMGPPPHPRCRCTLLPVRRLPTQAAADNGHKSIFVKR